MNFKYRRRSLRTVCYLLLAVPYLILAYLSAFIGKRRKRDSKRVIFGVSPLISNIYWCNALNANGWSAETWMTNNAKILPDKAFNIDFSAKYGKLTPVMMAIIFLKVLAKPAVIVTTCEGFLIGQSILWKFEAPLLRFAGCSTVVIPYGGDSYSYRRMSSTMLQQAIQFSYPEAARAQRKIEKRVDYWTEWADVFIPGVMYLDGFGRADVLTPSPFCIDTDSWSASRVSHNLDAQRPLTITHTPNHQGFKGTEFLVDAVSQLKLLGHNIELKLVENKSNSEIKKILTQESDIHVDQLIADGYGFSAIEGMSAGIPVIANLSRHEFTLPLRQWSFLEQCPIVSSNIETVFEALLKLVTDASLREELGKRSREFVLSYHSYDSFARLFEAIADEIQNNSGTLRNFYRNSKLEQKNNVRSKSN